MSILAFGATATIGSARYAQNISEARVAGALAPGVGSARLLLPRDLAATITPGDDVAIALAGEGSDPVDAFTGTVHAVHRGTAGTTVLCGDAASALARLRPGATYEQQSATAVIEALAREAGVGTGTVEADLDLVGYVAHQGRTALEHVAVLAGWAGAVATTDADGALVVRPFPSPPADLALRYGREIADLAVRTVVPDAALVYAGSGPAGSTSAPTARRQTTGVLPDGAPAPGADAVRVPAPALRTPAGASGAAEAAAERNGAARLRATCWLVPAVRAGTVVEIADAPHEGSAGPWLVTRVEHRVGPGARGVSTFEAIALEPAGGGLGGLLGAAAGAIGGLL